LLGFTRNFFPAETAGDFAEGFGGNGVGLGVGGVERRCGLVRRGRGGIFFARFDADLLFRRENSCMFEVVVAVNVFAGFLLSGCGGFAGFFLTRGFRDVLRLDGEYADARHGKHSCAEAQAALQVSPG
jgi:hypothetical protein